MTQTSSETRALDDERTYVVLPSRRRMQPPVRPASRPGRQTALLLERSAAFPRGPGISTRTLELKDGRAQQRLSAWSRSRKPMLVPAMDRSRRLNRSTVRTVNTMSIGTSITRNKRMAIRPLRTHVRFGDDKDSQALCARCATPSPVRLSVMPTVRTMTLRRNQVLRACTGLRVRCAVPCAHAGACSGVRLNTDRKTLRKKQTADRERPDRR